MEQSNLILIGMPGCGKSTVGVVLAKILCMEFVDVDLLIQKRHGRSLQELLDALGTQAFLELEADEVVRLSCSGSVIAPGGSAVLTERGGAALRSLGTTVYLRIPCDELERRLSNLATRGVAMAPGQTIRDVYEQRAPHYEKWADVTVDLQDKTIEETCAEILKALMVR